MPLPLLVATVLVSIQSDIKCLEPADSKWILRGCPLGATSAEVVARLGQPVEKTGMLATSKSALAKFALIDIDGISSAITCRFDSGKLTAVEGIRANFAKTTLPRIGDTFSKVQELLGRPYEPGGVAMSPDYKFNIQGYQRGLIACTFIDGRVTNMEFSVAGRKSWLDREAAGPNPSLYLWLVKSSCSITYSRSNPEKGSDAETTGIVRNDRDESATIRVRVSFSTEHGSFLKADETVLPKVEPKETRIFTIVTRGLAGDPTTNKYGIELTAL